MRTEYSKDFCKKLKYTLSAVFLLLGVVAQAQVDEEEDETARDTIKGYNTGKVEIDNPKSIVEAYTYDPITNRYIYTNKFEGFNITYPIILTPEEYQELVLRESMRNYFQEKSNAMDGKGTEEQQKDLLPRYYVNSSFFETIFGGNTIDIKPQGSVELDLGVRFTKTDNPSLSPRNRRTFAFDFDQRISMGIQGKVGTRLGVTANYDTESTFAFQNLIKLEYTPTEDDILQKIEVGNVSFPLSNSLVRGAQSLFGVKVALQFGKTTFTGVYSEQKSQTRTVTAQGGGTVQDFELFALDYEMDRHFFLSQYFRNNYDLALANYPYINSRVQITRIEVWVTNRQNRINAAENNSRNIIALQDLGEGPLRKNTLPTGADITEEAVGYFQEAGMDFFNPGVQYNSFPDNENNKLDPEAIGTTGWLTQDIREIVTVGPGAFTGEIAGSVTSEGTDYSKLENARKLSANEYTYHAQLGYISLNQKLSNDEVLAVAYQYTVGGDVYQVGEFGTDGVAATQVDNTNPTPDPETPAIPVTQSLILKMLKSSLMNVDQPVWDLMMKNIYQIPGAYQLSQEDFRFNILYTDPSPLNYIVPAGDPPTLPLPADVADTPLLRVFNVDRLNYTNDPQTGGDGFFDFVPGLTVDTQYGRIIFTNVEPFGEYLYDKLDNDGDPNLEGYHLDEDESEFNPNQERYVYRSMYKSTPADALQDSQKNKFLLKGRFKSTGGDGISLGAFNVPQGSVVVTAGGRVLVEGQDYTVNYQLGRVQILDPSLQASNTPIEVSVENNAVFGQQTRRFAGFNIEHKFSDKFLIGGTLLNMSERPFTQKTNYGQESVNNTIYGLNATFSTEVPFFTRLVNKLPNLDTDVPSNFSFRGEVAYLQPGASKADQFNGEATTYVDDFEGSQTNIDMRSAQGWTLSSVPREALLGGEQPTDDLRSGYRRAKLSWYSIDPVFYASNSRPSGINQEDVSTAEARRIYYNELYPQTDVPPGQTTVVNTLNLTYYPQERGPYNFNNEELSADNNFTFTEAQAENNWGGIMRPINSTNFEQTNVEYIQFWVLDPFIDVNGNAINIDNAGTLEINLGELSEDILRDNRKQYENGLPGVNSNEPVFSSVWGDVPVSQSLIYAFDTDTGNRSVQDVGFDGLTDEEEQGKFGIFGGLEDPSADNYQFYLNANGSITERYKNYNGTDGNSPVDVGDLSRGNSTLPDTEDINRDNTMNTIDAYFRYQIPIEPNMQAGQGYLVDVREVEDSANEMENGVVPHGRWLLFKVPVDVEDPAMMVGGPNIRSIRFMRMFMRDFQREVTLRFGALDLVRGEWRRFTNTLDIDDENLADDATGFDVVALNIQENEDRDPIKYVSPPGVQREQLYNNNAVINQNEQSLSLRVYDPTGGDGGLEPGDSRAVFKNVNVDMRQYKKLRMFLHAEALPNPDNTGVEESDPLQNGEMKAFMRFGNDFTENFYQVEMALDKTAFGASSAEDIWPKDNEIMVTLSALTKLKLKVLGNEDLPLPDANGIVFVPATDLDPSLSEKMTIGIKGNPNFGNVRTLMLGVKNSYEPLTGAPHLRGEVWFNELRLSDMDSKGGMAAVASMDTNFADFATVSATGRMSTIGFGTIEQSPNERSREDVKQYDIVTNINLGKLLPKKWGINLPFNYGVGEEIITPEYDPFQQDVLLEQVIDEADTQAEKDNLRNRAIDYTKRKSINFIGVKKERAPEQKQHFYDVENVTLSYSYNQVNHHDYEIEDMLDQQVRVGADYAYAFKSKPVEPFKNSAFMKKSQYWKLLSDFNFNYLPSNISFSTNILRQFNRQEYRNVDVEGIPIDPLYRRNYFFNYQYGFNYNLTKSLKINYSASTSNIVRNYLMEDNTPIQDLTVWNDFWNPGEPNTHTQQLVANYDIPINKIPVFSFIKSTYTYNSTFNWLRSSDALRTIQAPDPEDAAGGLRDYDLGNTIQNSNSHKFNTTLNMDMLYKYVGLTGKKPAKNAPKPAPKPGEKVAAAPKPAAGGNTLVNGLIGVLTSVKNIGINYVENNGTLLPGYKPTVGFFGTLKPSWDFVYGSQDRDIRGEAAERGYLTDYYAFNQSYTQVTSKTLNLTAQIDLFPDFRIDLNADRTFAENHSEQYEVIDGDYNALSPYDFGNFQITTILIKTAFSTSDVNGSEAFDQFRENRLIVANRLAEQRYGNSDFPRYGDLGVPESEFASANAGYPVGFGRNNQAVLLPAFLAAYSGQDASKVSTGIFRDIPLPNWVIKYTGLMRYKFFKDNFKRFSLQHSYKATYNVNSFRSNFAYDEDPNARDNNMQGNFYNKVIISNVNLTEQFNPLIRVDFEMKNSIKILAEIRKDRTLNMSFDNNLLTEVKGNEYVLGLGYRIKDVTINSSLADNPTNTIKSDINFKADFTLRKNETIVRYLDYDNNQLGGGQNIWSVKFTADYSFSKNLTAIFYYDHSFSKAVISTAYPLTNIRTGFTLRYNFGN